MNEDNKLTYLKKCFWQGVLVTVFVEKYEIKIDENEENLVIKIEINSCNNKKDCHHLSTFGHLGEIFPGFLLAIHFSSIY